MPTLAVHLATPSLPPFAEELFVVFDKGRVEMIPKKGDAGALKGLVKWRGKPATLSQMDDAIAREACK